MARRQPDFPGRALGARASEGGACRPRQAGRSGPPSLQAGLRPRLSRAAAARLASTVAQIGPAATGDCAGICECKNERRRRARAAPVLEKGSSR